MEIYITWVYSTAYFAQTTRVIRIFQVNATFVLKTELGV